MGYITKLKWDQYSKRKRSKEWGGWADAEQKNLQNYAMSMYNDTKTNPTLYIILMQ